MKNIRIAVVGCGLFADFFIELFKAHPEVEAVYVCDVIKERAKSFSEKFDVPVIDSFEDALASDKINAVAIFTQRYMHGQMVIDALKAGKHVYSAVPCAVSVNEIKEIERLVRQTRLTYSMGETGYYRAATIYCREQFKAGTFGDFVYAEAQYNHDMRNMYDAFKSSGGAEWKKFAGVPPFFYPTHSTSMILSTMPDVYVTKVSGMGFVSPNFKDIYTDNYYDNPFGNEVMLARLSNGGIVRISENRNLGWHSPETYITQYYGTEGGYEFAVAKHYQAKFIPDGNGRVEMKDVSDQILPEWITKELKEDFDKGIQNIANGAGFTDMSPIQDRKRLPKAFNGLKNAHNGTHHYLIDDFCKAMATGKLSPTNIWAVARYNIPGLIAHESAKMGGVLLDVPDLGNPPSDLEMLDPYDFDYNND